MFESLATRYQVIIILICSLASRNAIGIGKRNEFIDTEYVLIFAMKQLNIAVVHQRLTLVSNPLSPEYGRFWTQKYLNDLTTNTDGNIIMKRYFEQNGVKIVHETLHGEYLVARASTTIWESLLNMKLYEYDHDSNCRQPTLFNNYTLDKNISSYVSAVFRVGRLMQCNSLAVNSVLRQVPSDDWLQRDSILSLWRHHECGIQGVDKNRAR